MLNMSYPSSVLFSNTLKGIIRGLETINQILHPINLLYFPTYINDSPIVQWRGLHLDTARHFFPVAYILRYIEGMCKNKFSVFHWHITDGDSFPLDLPFLTNFVEKVSYHGTHYYTSKDIKKIIEYCKVCGIR